MRKSQELPFTEDGLRALTEDLEEHHRELLPVMRSTIAVYGEELDDLKTAEERSPVILSGRVSRRKVLLGGIAGIGALVLAGCSSDDMNMNTTASTVGGGISGDLAVANLAAALENTAVAAYQGGIDAALANRLGPVPPAVVAFAQTVQQQHQDHADAWNAILRQSNQPAQTGVNTSISDAVVRPALAELNDVPGLAKLALSLESSAAATYQKAIAVLGARQVILTAATIQPVEMQHIAVLNFIIGQDPVQAAFASTEGARGVDDKLGPTA